MKLSKSKYCNGIQCKKMLWLDKYKSEYKEELGNNSVLDNGNEVHEIARNLFGKNINIEFNDNLNEMVKDTKKALDNQNVVITEASFVYQDNFCSVDILKKCKDEYEMYEVKSSTHLKDIFVNDLSYQYYVLTKLGLNVTKAFVVIIDSSYVRKEELELNKLFKKIDCTDNIILLQNKVTENIKEINDYMKQIHEPKDDIGIKCFEPYKCPFFNYCIKDIVKPNIFDIRLMSNKKKLELYKKNKYKYQDLLNEEINNKYKEQIEYELYNKKDKIEKKNIKAFLSKLSYPLYFLDFETFQISIPKYEGIKPYEQIPFQYSLHFYENIDGKLKHKEFLSETDIDPRRKVAEHLVQDIPKNVCVLAYNMSFEKNVIKNLANLYPDLKDHLMKIYDNINDLMIPFKNRDYYTKDMHGSYSIKYVLPALFPDESTLDYHNLDMIHNGSEAMDSFINLGNKTKDEQKIIRTNLLKYCYLDTYAMVKIFDKLQEVVK